MQKRFIPELLSPAGGLEKLKIAVDYGADAVYLGGEKFGLRAAAENFSTDQLISGIQYAHSFGCKTFITLNSFFHDEDFTDLDIFIELLESIGADAIIVSDIGVIHYLKNKFDIEIHLSTQASCLNAQAALVYKDLGVKRLVLGREVSLKEAGKIKRLSGLEVELFVHGSMCMAYSGQCVISNYTAGRDSNRGGCAHSCRFEYDLIENENHKLGHSKIQESTFMSSKDLNGLDLLPQYIEQEIDSIKIEGRMKSVHYASSVTKAYKMALSEYGLSGKISNECFEEAQKLLSSINHRDYTTASLENPADRDSIYDERNFEKKDISVIGEVIQISPANDCIIKVRARIKSTDQFEILTFKGQNKVISNLQIRNFMGEPTSELNPGQLLKIPYIEGVEVRNILRKVHSAC